MMGNTRIGALRVDLGMNTAAFEKGADLATRKLNAFSKSINKVGRKMRDVGKNLTIGITAPLVAFGYKATEAATKSREAIAQVNAALASMGQGAGRTAEDLKKLAKELQHTSTFNDDEILRKVTANMLTFGSVSGEAFDRAQKAAVDLSARLGQDLQQSTIMVGKALNDPILGLTAMRRVGIQFTDSQEDMIKGMVKVGDIAGAQAVMLSELERQFGGSAQAARDAAPGSDTIDAWRDFQEAIGEIVLKALPPLTDLLTKVLNAFNGLTPEMQETIVKVAAVAAAIGPVVYIAGAFATAIGGIATAVGFLLPLLAPLAAAIYTLGGALLPLAMNPAVWAFAGVITGIYLAWKYWDQIVPILERLWAGAKKYIAGALTRVLQGVLGPILAVKKAFFDLYDAVVGHSYIPDMVNGIQREMSRLDSAMVDPAQKAAKKTKDIMRDMATEIRSLLDELFPDIARLNAMKRNLELLDKSGLKGDALDDARYRAKVLAGFGTRQGEAEISAGVLNQGPLAEADQVKDAAERVAKSIKILGDKTGVQTVRIAKSFAEMAQGAVDSLRGLISAIKGGGFLDILSSVFGIIDKFGILGGSKGLGGLVSSFAGLFADGGRFPANKFGIVGENGPELFMPGRAGYVVPNHALGKMSDGRGGVTVNVDARGATDPAAIEQAARRAVLEAAPTIVAASENRTLRTLRRPRLGGMGA